MGSKKRSHGADTIKKTKNATPSRPTGRCDLEIRAEDDFGATV